MDIEKKDFLYEGKAKRIYQTNQDDILWLEFKDDLTAFNAEKKGSFQKKGATNLKISQLIFDQLEKEGVSTHRIKQVSENEVIIKKVKIIPLEVVIRNKAAGSICKRLGFKSGFAFKEPMFEVFYKKDELADPLVTRENIEALQICSMQDLEKLKSLALKVNQTLIKIFKQAQIDLIDFKIEFGLDKEGQILLADEISPDSCRLWDIKTGEIMDKDRFRKDMGKVDEYYNEILQRLEKI